MQVKPVKLILGICCILCIFNGRVAAQGSISGKITAPGGAGIEDCDIFIFAAGENSSGVDARSAADGTYSAEGLPSGTYKVYFSPNNGNFATEWYNNKGSLWVADIVSVTAPNDTPGSMRNWRPAAASPGK